MAFYLIGVGLDDKSISLEAIEACKKADKVYFESYTAELPYKTDELEKILGKRIIKLSREEVENEKFVDEAIAKNIALLVYGSPLAATTHISLIFKCRKERIPFRIFQNAGIFDAIAETGLQLYKFGRTASMPAWKNEYQPTSFIDIINENQKIKAHTLLLIDIGLGFDKALNQLNEASAKAKNKIKLDKIVVCSRIGTKYSMIYYDKIEKLRKLKGIEAPFCLIIPAKLHFLEQEALELLTGKSG